MKVIITLLQPQENARVLQEWAVAYINTDSSIEGVSFIFKLALLHIC